MVDKFFVEYTDEEINNTFEYDTKTQESHPTRQDRYSAMKDLNGIIIGNTYDRNEGIGKGTMKFY